MRSGRTEYVCTVNIPRLFLQNQMRLHKELDAQPQSTGRYIIHLLADAVPQIQPQVLSLAARELQPKVVHFNYAQFSANLEREERNGSQNGSLTKKLKKHQNTNCVGQSIRGSFTCSIKKGGQLTS